MANVAVLIENLSKRYQIGAAQDRHDTLRDQLAAGFKSLFHPNGRRAGAKSDNTFWALKDVSFEVKEGEVVGIIGANGAGKSTLLKILSRITEPTEGRATIRGRVGSLLEVGTGFHPELTGRENIYLNGAILGMRKTEIDRKFDEIVDFSGVERFIETPVKRYSSGMHVRLAFAVAAYLEPEVLIIDEVLAVGDAEFQKKCLGKMDAISKQGRTVLFVSHNMPAIRNLCSQAYLLMNGRIQLFGTAEYVVQQYLAMLEPNQGKGPSLAERQDRAGDGTVRAIAFDISVPHGQMGGAPQTGAPIDFVIGYNVRQASIKQLYAGIVIVDSSGADICTLSTQMSNSDFPSVSGRGKLTCRLDYLPLKPGKYSIKIKLQNYVGHSRYQTADEVNNAASFEVVESGDSGFFAYGSGPLVAPHRWLLSSECAERNKRNLARA